MTSKPSIPLNIRFPHDLLRQIVRAADAEHRTVSGWIKAACAEKLGKESK